jgi:hypothetical protein
MGGRVDPETGKVVWEMHVALEEQLAYYRSHPPKALESLRVRALDQVDFTFDGHGEPINAIFEVTCPCGGGKFVAVGNWDGEDDVEPPITLECAECERDHVVFDEALHGHERAVGNAYCPPDDRDLAPVELGEAIAPYEIVVRFELPSDVLGDPAYSGREQEHFTWISILARTEEGELRLLFERECA